MLKIALFCLTALASLGGAARAGTELLDRDALRKKFGFHAYVAPEKLKNVKVAILDNGFQGYDAAKDMLPKSTELVTNLTSVAPAPSNHGLGMAQILWALTGRNAEGPKFYLVNTNGFSNLKAAVKYVIDNKIDVVLYSQVWPFGSNFDGTGFINALVTQAINAGTLWINAAGNNGGMVYNGQVEGQRTSGSAWLSFNGRDHLRIENRLDENNITVALSWTDFTDSELYNTRKDLDLFVYDENDKLVASSELIQRGEAPPAGATDSKLSSHAREVVTLSSLDRGNYRVKIKVGSNNFAKTDRFRVLLKSDKPIAFPDRTLTGEVMPPADHPLAVTVGEKTDDTATGPTADGRVKPEVLVEDSTVGFSNGAQYRGSSTAAAIIAAAVALMKSEAPAMTQAQLRSFITGRLGGGGTGSSDSDLRSAELTPVSPAILQLIPSGGRLMIHTGNSHFVILCPGDPFDLPQARAAGVKRVLADDILVASPSMNQWYVLPKNLDYQIKQPLVEFRRSGGGAALSSSVLWRTPDPWELRSFLGTP